MVLVIDLTGLDPNIIVGWLAVLGVTAGALYKVGNWIVALRSDIQRALVLLEEGQRANARHERLIVYILGHLGIDITKVVDPE